MATQTGEPQKEAEEVTIESNDPKEAIHQFETVLSQGKVPVLGAQTQQLVNQYYWDFNENFPFLALQEEKLDKMLRNIEIILNQGLPVQLDDNQQLKLRNWIEKQEKRPHFTLQGTSRFVIKHNLQLMQNLGIQNEISEIARLNLPSDPITVQLLHKQKRKGLFLRYKRVPDLSETLIDATRLALLGVRMKLSPEIITLLKATQAKIKTENEMNKGKKKPKLSKEGQSAKNILEKYKVLEAEIKKANIPISFTEFEKKKA